MTRMAEMGLSHRVSWQGCSPSTAVQARRAETEGLEWIYMSATSVPVKTLADQRRDRRASWPVRRFRLGDEPGEDLSSTTTAEERIAMMWPLALDAFSIEASGSDRSPRPLWPVRVRRLGEPAVD